MILANYFRTRRYDVHVYLCDFLSARNHSLITITSTHNYHYCRLQVVDIMAIMKQSGVIPDEIGTYVTIL